MKLSIVAVCLKILIAVIALAALPLFYVLILSNISVLGKGFPEFSFLVLPSQIAVCISAAPCYFSLFHFWRICTRMAKGYPYCKENAASLRVIGLLAFSDTILCLAVTIYISIYNASNGGTLIIAFLIMMIGIITSILTLALSNLVRKIAG
jgi:hypothetical protein